MFAEVDEREDDACGEEDSEDEACDSLRLDRFDGDVAGCCVDEGAIGEEQWWGVGREDEDTVAFV